MKAILIIDIPNDCYGCPCLYEDFESCQASNYRRIDPDQIGRPTWCPLRQIPNQAAETIIMGLDAIEKMKSVEVRTVRKTE